MDLLNYQKATFSLYILLVFAYLVLQKKGRWAMIGKKQMVKTGVGLPADMVAWIDECARKEERSRSSWIRKALREAYEKGKHEEENPAVASGPVKKGKAC